MFTFTGYLAMGTAALAIIAGIEGVVIYKQSVSVHDLKKDNAALSKQFDDYKKDSVSDAQHQADQCETQIKKAVQAGKTIQEVINAPITSKCPNNRCIIPASKLRIIAGQVANLSPVSNDNGTDRAASAGRSGNSATAK